MKNKIIGFVLCILILSLITSPVEAFSLDKLPSAEYKELIKDWLSSGNNKYIVEFESEPMVKTGSKVTKGVSVSSSIATEHAQFKSDILGIKSTKGVSASSSDDIIEYSIVLNGMAAEMTPWQVLRAMNLDYVKKIHPSKTYEITLTDSIGIIRANDTWETQDALSQNITGVGTTIAILDTGIDYSHPDLGNCSTAEFIGGTCAKVIGGYDVVNDDNDPMDDHGHGTHCAATAAGDGVLKGVAPDAKLYGYKVLNSGGSGSDTEIILAIEMAVAEGVDIISMSLGGSGDPDDAFSIACDNAVDAGVVLTISAGNDGPDMGTIGCPGCARKVITVGASCKPSQVGTNSRCLNTEAPLMASFSSRGYYYGYQKPEVSAPGVMICAAQASQDTIWQRYMDDGVDIHCVDDTHMAISGTSMAAPHVAGASALMIQAHPDWDPMQIKAAFERTSYDFGYDINVQGRGQIDVYEATQLNRCSFIWTYNTYFKLDL